jgi:hypothetical protein
MMNNTVKAKMFKVTITDEFEKTIVLSVADVEELLAVMKVYTSAESFDLLSILVEPDEEYYNPAAY